MREHHEFYAPRWVSADQEPKSLFTQILPGLFMGGTEDHDVVSVGGPLPRDLGNQDFDAVATLYAWAKPVGWGVEEMRLGIYDAEMDDANVERVLRLAHWSHERWTAGDRVLIRCQAGLNRSGLVTALTLMLEGFSASDAISMIRNCRSEVALFNNDFVDWLMNEAPRYIHPQSDSSAA